MKYNVHTNDKNKRISLGVDAMCSTGCNFIGIKKSIHNSFDHQYSNNINDGLRPMFSCLINTLSSSKQKYLSTEKINNFSIPSNFINNSLPNIHIGLIASSILFFVFCFFNKEIFRSKISNIKSISILCFFIIFIAHSFESFDPINKIFYINNNSDFDTREQYQSSALHVVIDSIIKITEKAFIGWNLETVKIGEAVNYIMSYAFSSCNNLNSIIIGENVTTIQVQAFASCKSLVNITIPSRVKTLYANTFLLCVQLQVINVSKQNPYYANYENDGILYTHSLIQIICYPIGRTNEVFEIPNTVRDIDRNAFYSCNNLKIIIGESVTTIGVEAFYFCENLETIILGDNLKIIESQAFSSCKSLTSITIPSNVETIEVDAFGVCINFQAFNVSIENLNFASYEYDGVLYNKNISKLIIYPVGKTNEIFEIPETVTIIGNYAFSSCNNLKKVIIGENVKEICDYAFYNLYNLETVIIGENVKEIGNFSFCSCSSLKNFTIPNKVETIGNSAFNRCKNLETVVIGENVKVIPNDFLAECSLLKTIVFGESVTKILSYAFHSCTSLVNITITSKINDINTNAFNLCSKLQIINVSKDNSNYANYENDGILYDKEINEIVCYPIGRTNDRFEIPVTVTTIGKNAFLSCANLETVIIRENVIEIGESAFSSCENLKCIYFFGENEPTITEKTFSGVPATSVMTNNSYKNPTFGSLNVSKGTVIDECLPPTLTFSQSNTFTPSNAFTQSNTFTESNTFTKSNPFSQSNTFSKTNSFTKSNTFTSSNAITQSNSFTSSYPFDATITFSYVIIYSVSITRTITLVDSFSSVTFVKSSVSTTNTYVSTNFIYYTYSVLYYTSHYSYYSNFFTILLKSAVQQKENNQNILIGLICGSIGFVLLLSGIIIFLVRHQKQDDEEKYKRKQAMKSITKHVSTEYDTRSDDIDLTHIALILEDDDKWLL